MNAEFDRLVQLQVEAFARSVPYHSLELNDGTIIPGLIPVEALRARLNSYPELAEVRGKRILDVGAASGWNSFELERRGASVVAIDCIEYEEFLIAKHLLNSKVDYRIMDVDEMSTAELGLFDYVLFFGVLYHLRHPLSALEKVCALTREAAFIESYVTDTSLVPENCTLEFYETNELGGQIDNWFGPTTQCLISLCRSAGFARVNLLYNNDRRAGASCFRHWAVVEDRDQPAPLLCVAINNRHDDIYFTRNKDEYICIHFGTSGPLELQDVLVEVDNYGAPAIVLASTGPHTWQVNIRVPPGLSTGDHFVRVRTRSSAPSNSARIVVLEETIQRPVQAAAVLGPERTVGTPPQLLRLENATDRSLEFRGNRKETMNCIFRCEEKDLDLNRLEVQIDEKAQPLLSAGPLSQDIWQVSLRLPRDLSEGDHTVRIRTAETPFSNPLAFTFSPQVRQFRP